MLRLCFKYDRRLLGLLSRCFYASVKELFQEAAGDRRSVPGMIASLQSYGDDPTRFHPHLHSLVTQGLVSPEGSFVPEKILRHLKLWNRPERPPPPATERTIQYDREIADFDEAGQWPDPTG